MPVDPALQETLEACYANIGVFGKTFLPETFVQPFRAPHRAILDAIDSDAQKIVIAAPRGIGKTSIAKAVAERYIAYRAGHLLGYVSQSETLAMAQTENIKRELLTNKEIRKVFGSIKIATDDPDMDEQFSKHAWVAYGDVMVIPRGVGQQIRGFLFKNYRWDLLIIDDMENRAELDNPENRRKNKDWFYADVIRSVDRYTNKYRIIYIDTVKHAESLIAELLEDPNWYSVRLEAFDDNYQTTIPELYSNAEIQQEVESARKNGTLDILYMELRNIVVASETRTFRTEYFKYYEEAALAGQELENVVIVDPAKTVQMTAADSAIVGIGVNYMNGAIYIRDVVSEKMFPDRIIEEAFEMALRLGAHVIGVEVTGLEEFIKQPFENYMQVKGPRYAVELIWLKARGGDPGGEKGKVKRIGALQPYYRQGYIYHNKSCCAKLESQLFNFPKSGLVDVADATAYIIEMLELGGRYFQVPPSELGASSEFAGVGSRGPYDEFAELTYDPPLTDWRLV